MIAAAVRALPLIVVLGGGVGGDVLASSGAPVRAPHPHWIEVKWPFPIDQWGTGRAFQCGADACGETVNLFLRAKIGFCNCSRGVYDDAELDRVGDIDLVGPQFAGLDEGRQVAVGWMKGRSRVFTVTGPYQPTGAAAAIAFNDKCDVVVATVTADHGDLSSAQREALNIPQRRSCPALGSRRAWFGRHLIEGRFMRSAVVVFPGINRERDMARALKLISGRESAMVWHADSELPAGTDLVVIPGGFSYGDYLRCGAIAARAPIMDAVRAFAAKGGLVLAVCNGFQIACEAGLLPGVLMRNAQLRFICRDVYLRVERSDTPFTRGYNAGQVIRIPVAHGEGNYIADGETIARLEGEGRVLFRYASPDGMIDPNWNHNGAMNAIAGIINERGNVLGMMPHPENHVEAAMGRTDGRGLFAGLVAHFAIAA